MLVLFRGDLLVLPSLLLSAGGGEGDLPDVVPGLCSLDLAASGGSGRLPSHEVHRATGLSYEILLTLRHQSLQTLKHIPVLSSCCSHVISEL